MTFPYLSAVFAVVLVVGASTCEIASGQISRKEAGWVLEHQRDISTKTADYIKTEYGQKDEGGSSILNAEFVQLVTADPSSWRFYSRDRGILIAIDVGRDVSLATQAQGPAAIARLAEGIIRQEKDMAIANRVRVVFIDPEAHELSKSRSAYGSAYLNEHHSWQQSLSHAWGTIAGVHVSGYVATQPCDCR